MRLGSYGVKIVKLTTLRASLARKVSFIINRADDPAMMQKENLSSPKATVRCVIHHSSATLSRVASIVQKVVRVRLRILKTVKLLQYARRVAKSLPVQHDLRQSIVRGRVVILIAAAIQRKPLPVANGGVIGLNREN
jgi:hypothetical protein